MTIHEAIKILKNYIGTGPEAEPVDFDTAIALGIEALKKLKANREYGPMAGSGLLPGETKD